MISQPPLLISIPKPSNAPPLLRAMQDCPISFFMLTKHSQNLTASRFRVLLHLGCSSRMALVISSPRNFQFLLKPSGKSLCLRVCEREVVSSLTDKIYKLTGIQEGNLRILYEGRQLKFENTLTDYGIKKDATISLIAGLLRGAR